MSPKQRGDTVDRILYDTTGDVTKLLRMGITEFAIIAYVERLRAGQSHDAALNALLEGRSLNRRQRSFVRAVLLRFQID